MPKSHGTKKDPRKYQKVVGWAVIDVYVDSNIMLPTYI